MFTSAAKTLLKNHIRHADTHNRMVEESEMWATHSKLSNMDKGRKPGNINAYRGKGDRTNSKYDKPSRGPNQFHGQNNSHDSFLYDDRDDSESPEDRCGAYMDRQPSDPVVSSRDLERVKKSRKTKQDKKAGIDRWDHSGFEKQNSSRNKSQDDERWGHSGYHTMYPGDFNSDHGKKRKRESYPKWSKKKKYKKRKKKRKKRVSKSEEKEERKKKAEEEKIKAAEANTKLGSLKQNHDLLLMQRFTSEVRPEKPSQPRMKMRTWNSDSSADSNSDNKYHKDKSRKYRSKKSRRKNYSDSSVDSSSDSESEEGGRYVKRKKVKKRKKKKKRRRYESDETTSDSDSGESLRSSRKKMLSSRTESTSESADSAGEYSDKNYTEKKYDKNLDLTDDSDFSDTDSDYSTAKNHRNKKKKHKYR